MPAVSRFGAVLCLSYMACWSGNTGVTTTQTASLEPGSRDVTGSYWCSIDEEGYDYPRYACAIKKVGDTLVLAKLGGSQRFRGQIKLDDKEGFWFVGESYCPDGDCDQELHGRFKPVGRGGFKGTFREESMVLHLVPAPANAFGGSEYGGGTYGDPFSYGGQGYGGSSYGGRRPRIDLRGGRRP
ncbi:MAG: hypothetical protein H6Q90_4106 [Deltaproteobacteria bacterium]|nr:hypothetical protein [Deltaproteobacteria bacterium]